MPVATIVATPTSAMTDLRHTVAAVKNGFRHGADSINEKILPGSAVFTFPCPCSITSLHILPCEKAGTVLFNY